MGKSNKGRVRRWFQKKLRALFGLEDHWREMKEHYQQVCDDLGVQFTKDLVSNRERINHEVTKALDWAKGAKSQSILGIDPGAKHTRTLIIHLDAVDNEARVIVDTKRKSPVAFQQFVRDTRELISKYNVREMVGDTPNGPSLKQRVLPGTPDYIVVGGEQFRRMEPFKASAREGEHEYQPDPQIEAGDKPE